MLHIRTLPGCLNIILSLSICTVWYHTHSTSYTCIILQDRYTCRTFGIRCKHRLCIHVWNWVPKRSWTVRKAGDLSDGMYYTDSLVKIHVHVHLQMYLYIYKITLIIHHKKSLCKILAVISSFIIYKARFQPT